MHRKEPYPSFSRGLKIPGERKPEKAPEDAIPSTPESSLRISLQSNNDSYRGEKKGAVWVWKVLSTKSLLQITKQNPGQQ